MPYFEALGDQMTLDWIESKTVPVRLKHFFCLSPKSLFRLIKEF